MNPFMLKEEFVKEYLDVEDGESNSYEMSEDNTQCEWEMDSGDTRYRTIEFINIKRLNSDSFEIEYTLEYERGTVYNVSHWKEYAGTNEDGSIDYSDEVDFDVDWDDPEETWTRKIRVTMTREEILKAFDDDFDNWF